MTYTGSTSVPATARYYILVGFYCVDYRPGNPDKDDRLRFWNDDGVERYIKVKTIEKALDEGLLATAPLGGWRGYAEHEHRDGLRLILGENPALTFAKTDEVRSADRVLNGYRVRRDEVFVGYVWGRRGSWTSSPEPTEAAITDSNGTIWAKTMRSAAELLADPARLKDLTPSEEALVGEFEAKAAEGLDEMTLDHAEERTATRLIRRGRMSWRRDRTGAVFYRLLPPRGLQNLQGVVFEPWAEGDGCFSSKSVDARFFACAGRVRGSLDDFVGLETDGDWTLTKEIRDDHFPHSPRASTLRRGPLLPLPR